MEYDDGGITMQQWQDPGNSTSQVVALLPSEWEDMVKTVSTPPNTEPSREQLLDMLTLAIDRFEVVAQGREQVGIPISEVIGLLKRIRGDGVYS